MPKIDTTIALIQLVKAAAPCDIHIGEYGNSASVILDFDASATQQQRTNAQNVVNNFDWSDAAQAVRDAARFQDRNDLRTAAAQAVSDIDTFLAIGSPSNAQILAAVRRLAQIDKQLIKRLIQID